MTALLKLSDGHNSVAFSSANNKNTHYQLDVLSNICYPK